MRIDNKTINVFNDVESESAPESAEYSERTGKGCTGALCGWRRAALEGKNEKWIAKDDSRDYDIDKALNNMSNP